MGLKSNQKKTGQQLREHSNLIFKKRRDADTQTSSS